MQILNKTYINFFFDYCSPVISWYLILSELMSKDFVTVSQHDFNTEYLYLYFILCFHDGISLLTNIIFGAD